MEGRKPLFQYRVVNNFNRPKCCVNAKRDYVCSVKQTHTTQCTTTSFTQALWLPTSKESPSSTTSRFY